MKIIKKLKSLRKNNSGFTLVELVVATAVLGIISVAVLNMMSTGSNLFNVVHKRSLTLFKSQVAAVQLRDAITNCGSGIGVEGNTLYIADKQSATTGTITVYSFDSTNNKIDFRQDTIEKNGENIHITEGTEGEGTRVPFCFNVSSLTYFINANNISDNSHLSAIRFDITTTKLGQNTTRKETISLRSNPLLVREANEGESFETTMIKTVWR